MIFNALQLETFGLQQQGYYFLNIGISYSVSADSSSQIVGPGEHEIKKCIIHEFLPTDCDFSKLLLVLEDWIRATDIQNGRGNT